MSQYYSIFITIAILINPIQKISGAQDYNGNLIIKNKFVFNNTSTNSYIQSVMKNTINFDGLLDQTFGGLISPLGTNYIQNFILRSSYEPYTAMALQTDGKIVIVGSYQSSANISYFAAARFLPDGNIDISFGGKNGQIPGTMYIPFFITQQNGTDDECYAVAIQSDGKIILGGFSSVENNDPYSQSYYYGRYAAARLMPNGVLDESFGGNNGQIPGTMCVEQSIIPDQIDYCGSGCQSIVIDRQQNILMGGWSYPSSGYQGKFSAVRLLSDGSLDLSFGGPDAGYSSQAGTMFLPSTIVSSQTLNRQGDAVYSVALQNDEKIVMGGFSNATSNNYYMAVARLLPNGAVDETFGYYNSQAGTMYINPPIAGGTGSGNSYDRCHSLKIQNDGKIILAGVTQDAVSYYFAAARLLSNGHLDTSFGGYNSQLGTMYISEQIAGNNGTDDTSYGLVLQSDGKIVLGGYSSSNNSDEYHFASARLLSNGQLDTTFGGTISQPGTTYLQGYISDGNENMDYAYSVALQSDQKIILGGTTEDGNRFGIIQMINPITLTNYQTSYVGNGSGLYS